MRPGRVVLADPRIDCGLRGGQVRERDRVIEQLAAQAAVEPLDLARGRRERGWVSRWMMPLSRQIRSNSTSPPLPNRSVNCLPLSVSTSPGTPNCAQRGGERQAHRPAGRPDHDQADHAVPGMVIDPGHELGLGPVGQEHPADDVQLPQRHRLIALPPQVAVLGPLARAGLDQAMPDQDPVDAHPRRHRRPPRPCPARAPAAADPTADAPGAARTPPPLTCADWCGHDPAASAGPPARPGRPAHSGGPRHARSAATPQPGPRPRSPEPRPAASRTARYRCSTTDNSTSANPGLPPHSTPANDDATEKAELHGTCKPSGGTAMSSIYRDRTLSRSLRCRIEPFLDQGGACGAAGAPVTGLCAWDARPARARRAAQQPQINPALGADRATGLIRPVSHTSFGREGSAVHPQMPRPKPPVPGPAQERVTCHRPHFWPTGCHPCPQTEQVGPFFFLPNMVTYTPPVRTTGSACPKCCVLDGGGEPWGLTGAISGPLTPVAGSLPVTREHPDPQVRPCDRPGRSRFPS